LHILMVVAFGLVALAGFVLAASLLNRTGWAVDGAYAFIWVWLVASLVNGAVGILYVGIPLINELAALVPIFGIPAGAAWYLSRRFRRARATGQAL
jgi:hypothetical protein